MDEREGGTKTAYMRVPGEEANMLATGAGSGREPIAVSRVFEKVHLDIRTYERTR